MWSYRQHHKLEALELENLNEYKCEAKGSELYSDIPVLVVTKEDEVLGLPISQRV